MQLFENHAASETDPDQHRTTKMSYTVDNQIKALNSVTETRMTTRVYGTHFSDSDVARNNLILRGQETTRHYALHNYFNVTALFSTSGAVAEILAVYHLEAGDQPKVLRRPDTNTGHGRRADVKTRVRAQTTIVERRAT